MRKIATALALLVMAACNTTTGAVFFDSAPQKVEIQELEYEGLNVSLYGLKVNDEFVGDFVRIGKDDEGDVRYSPIETRYGVFEIVLESSLLEIVYSIYLDDKYVGQIKPNI